MALFFCEAGASRAFGVVLVQRVIWISLVSSDLLISESSAKTFRA